MSGNSEEGGLILGCKESKLMKRKIKSNMLLEDNLKKKKTFKEKAELILSKKMST